MYPQLFQLLFHYSFTGLEGNIYIYTGKQGVFPSKLGGFPIKIEAFPWLSCHVSLKPILSPSNWRGFPWFFPQL